MGISAASTGCGKTAYPVVTVRRARAGPDGVLPAAVGGLRPERHPPATLLPVAGVSSSGLIGRKRPSGTE